jgi:thioester reductase-like protein
MSKPDVNSEAYIIPPPPAPESAEDRENDFGWGFEDIHRPGEVSGASTSGIWKMNDAVLRLLVASVQAAALPVGELRFHLTPVDYVAQAVVALSLDPRCWRRAFNLINGRVMSHGGLGGIIKALGYPMEMVAVDEWKRRLFALPEGSAFKPLESLLKENKPGAEGWEQRYGAGEARFDVRRTEEALLDAGISCPPVDEALVRTYFRYLVRAGHVPPAAGPSRDLD